VVMVVVASVGTTLSQRQVSVEKPPVPAG
jgi:hypothetical protein